MGEAAGGKIVRRGPTELLLAIEALILLAFFRACLGVVSVRRILNWVTRGSVAAIDGRDRPATSTIEEEAIEPEAAATALRVRWAVEAVARNSPIAFVCFPQTLAGYTMLRRRGVRSTMVYGVMRSAEGALLAHTWLLVEDRVVLGGEGSDAFTAVERWG